MAASFALEWLMRRKQPGKICRADPILPSRGRPRKSAQHDFMKKNQWIIAGRADGTRLA